MTKLAVVFQLTHPNKTSILFCFVLFYVYGCGACMNEFVLCVCYADGGRKTALDLLGIGATIWAWEQNPQSLQEQPVLLTTELFL